MSISKMSLIWWELSFDFQGLHQQVDHLFMCSLKIFIQTSVIALASESVLQSEPQGLFVLNGKVWPNKV